MPPTILHSDPRNDEAMQIIKESNTAFVVVQDSNDPESLRFQWWISGEGVLGYAEPLTGEDEDFIGSKITLPHEASWDGRTLNCVVYDSYNASDSRSWPIVVTEGN